MTVTEDKTVSIEFFPPRTEAGVEKLLQAARTFSIQKPEFFSVTFGAGGSSQNSTLTALQQLRKATQVPLAAHISCINSTPDSIRDLLAAYRALGIARLVVLRGDLPSGQLSPGSFRYASDLVRFIRQEVGDYFTIEVAAYPESHPESSNYQADLKHFKTKVEAGADRAITQYFYNADAYFAFRDAAYAMGVDVPIIPGIMPLTNFTQLARFSEHCGAEIPKWLRQRLSYHQEDLNAIAEIGQEFIFHFSEQLLKGGAPGLHFYCLNKCRPTADLLQALFPVTASAELV